MSTTQLAEVAAQICSARQLQFEGFLGAGAFKQTFLAIAAEGHRVALKVAVTSPSLQPRLEREALALNECTHRSIAKLLDCFPFDCPEGRFWVTIEEFISGGTLERLLSSRRLSPAETCALALPLAEALGHLYTRRLVHRDIKPANILFREDGAPVLTDFGIVRMLGKPSLTHDFLAVGPGTPLYASPEQLNNEKASIDWRTDQFALALVVYRCLFGVHPFTPRNGSEYDAVANVGTRQPVDAGVRQQLQSVGLSGLVRSLECWAVNRYRWPQDFVDVFKKKAG